MNQHLAGPGSSRRPLSVTIVAILAGVGGIALVLAVFAGAAIHGPGSLNATELIIVLGALVLSALYLGLAHGAWTLKPWGWNLGIVAGIASIGYMTAVLLRGWADLVVDAPPLALVGVGVVAIATVGLVVWFRPEIKRAFRDA